MIAQVIRKNLARPTGLLVNNEPHVRGDLHIALVAPAVFVVHRDIILKVSRECKLFLLRLCDTERKTNTPKGQEVDTANALDVHGRIIP